jgi:two-component system sensor histidine kinase BaeS
VTILPASFRGRVALAIVAALVIAVVAAQLLLGLFVGTRVQREVEDQLRQQGAQIAAIAEQEGYPGIAEAKRFLPGTQVVVRRDGEVIFWSDPVRVLEARAIVRSGDIEVTLERQADAGVWGEWAIPAVTGGVILLIGGVSWWLAGLASRRLRREAMALAGQVERVAGGDLDTRVDVGDGELARVATSLNAMTERLADTDRRQREFLADVAHELRTPVTAIDGFASALVDGAARTEDDRTEAAQIIKGESERLTALVADLQALTLADLDQEVVREPVDVVACCGEVVGRLEGAAAERGVLLRGPVAGQEPIVVATNAAHVHTILTNLTTNALRATPAGGTVRVTAAREPGAVAVQVSDTGVGIAAEHLPRIFDRMYRADSARDRASGGTGLGLAIVKGLSEALDARIEVESAPGEGSTFRLVLPDPPGATAPDDDDPAAAPGPA